MNNINAFYIQNILKSWRPLYTEWNIHLISKVYNLRKIADYLGITFSFFFGHMDFLFLLESCDHFANLNLCLCASESRML